MTIVLWNFRNGAIQDLIGLVTATTQILDFFLLPKNMRGDQQSLLRIGKHSKMTGWLDKRCVDLGMSV